MKRSIIGGIVGTLAGGMTVMILEMIGHAIWPLPPGVHDPDQVKSFLLHMPLPALAWIVFGFAGGAFVGGLVAAAIARKMSAALAVGALLLLATIAMMFEITHPGWMIILGLLVPLPAAWLGGWLMTRRGAA